MKFGPRAGAFRPALLVLLLLAAAFLALVAFIVWTRRDDFPGTPAPGSRSTPLHEAGWELTAGGDFEERIADLTGSRLRLRAATRRTRSDTVKFMGVRHREEVALKPGTRIKVDFDWNRQTNGSGLAAGLLLAPAVTSTNPYELPDYVWIEYIGVPPGRNARRVIGVRAASNHRHLDMEGWPEKNKEGRAIEVLRLEVEIGADRSFRLLENGQEAYASPPGTLPFDKAFVYLQLSSRSNYPPREVFFENFAALPGK